MDSSLQIDTVQKFAEVIGDNDNLWNLLFGREVSRFDEEVIYTVRYKKTGIKGKVIAIYTQTINEGAKKGGSSVLVMLNY